MGEAIGGGGGGGYKGLSSAISMTGKKSPAINTEKTLDPNKNAGVNPDLGKGKPDKGYGILC